MSDQFKAIAAEVSDVVTALEPLVAELSPTMGPALVIGMKIVQGLLAAEPTAVNLYNQIKNGTPATPLQLQQFSADYEASYQQLNTDIAAKLAALPA